MAVPKSARAAGTVMSTARMKCTAAPQQAAYAEKQGISVCLSDVIVTEAIKFHREKLYLSDFLLKDADPWRKECWAMMKERKDCWFYFFTKRIERLADCLPPDWGEGYENVLIGCTIENQDRADYRLPIFNSLPIKHKSIIAAPLLERINIAPFLNESIEEVSVGGESGYHARPCNYDWILDLRNQCVEKNIPFRFHQTGANFIKDGKCYRIKRPLQRSQARKAGIDFRIGENFIPDTAKYHEPGDVQLSFDI